MPSAGDPFLGPGGLPISHSPLQRIGYFPNKPQPPSIDDLIDAVQQWLGEFLFPAIKRYTGIDLGPFLPIINNVVDNLQLLFGFLDQDTSTFDKVAAGAYLIENVLQYTGLLATIESLGKLMTGIDGATGGLISQFFNDIRYIIGDPLGLGTGTVIIGSSPFDIPLLAPITELVQQLIDGLFHALGGTGAGTVSSVVSYLTSVVGDLSGLVSDIAAFVAAVGGGNMSGAGTALAGVVSDFTDLASNLSTFLTATGQATWAALGALINSLIDFLTTVPAELISGTLTGAVEIGGRAVDVLVQHLNAAGQYDAAYLLGEIGDAVTIGGTGIATTITDVFNQIQAVLDAIFQAINGGITTGNTPAAVKAALEAIPGANILISGVNTLPGYLTNINSSGQLLLSGATGALNTAVTIGGQAVSTLFNGSGQFIGVINSAATGALNTGLTVGGVALNTLFTNINSSGQILGAGITGAINTAATLGGTALGTLATNWNAAVTNVNSLIGGVTGASTAADVATNINLAATNIAQIGTAGQNAAAGVVGTLNTAATQVQTAFSGILNSLFGGFTGTPAPVNQTQAQVTAAAQNVATNFVGNAATFVGIQNAEAAAANLMSVKFNFADYGTGTVALSSSFTVSNDPTYTNNGGGIQIVDGRATYQATGVGSAHKIARYNVAPTTTDYMEVSWVHTGDQDGAGGSGHSIVYARMNSAATSFLQFITLNGNTLAVNAVVAGSGTGITSYTNMKPGARYIIKCGDLSDNRKIYLYENDALVLSFTDAVHQVGASYRYAAFGVSGNNTGTPLRNFAFNVFGVADQVFKPGPAGGAYVSTTRTTTSTSYTDMTDTTDTITVTIGSSGMAQVSLSGYLYQGNLAQFMLASFAVSGATTMAASDSKAIAIQAANTGTTAGAYLGAPFLVTGLNPGSNTFKMKYRVTAGTGGAAERRISAIPL